MLHAGSPSWIAARWCADDVFALIKTATHNDSWIDEFRRVISAIPEIVEAHRVTGSVDYILKIVLPSAEHYDMVYKQIVRQISLFDVSASISMES